MTYRIAAQHASDAEHSLAAAFVRRAGTSVPFSFNDDGWLFALNLFLMTAFTCLGVMMAGRMAWVVFRHRGRDGALDPVTVWRATWGLAGAAAALRCGAEAMSLWAWNPADAVITARVLMAKRWVDPLALMLAGGWMLLVTLSDRAMEAQLSRQPLPVDMLARLPALRRPLAVVLLSLIAAVGAACTR